MFGFWWWQKAEKYRYQNNGNEEKRHYAEECSQSKFLQYAATGEVEYSKSDGSGQIGKEHSQSHFGNNPLEGFDLISVVLVFFVVFIEKIDGMMNPLFMPHMRYYVDYVRYRK